MMTPPVSNIFVWGGTAATDNLRPSDTVTQQSRGLLLVHDLCEKKTAYSLSIVVLADARKQQKLNVLSYKHELGLPTGSSKK